MIRTFLFSDGKLVGQDLDRAAIERARGAKGHVLWVDLESPGSEETTAILGELFNFHPLAIEDCLAPNSLPKVEDFEDYLFIVTHGVDFARTEKFNTAELELFLGRDYLVTYHASPLKSVAALAEKLSRGQGPAPRGPDRIMHTLLDMLIDHFIPVVDAVGTELEALEEHVLAAAAGEKKTVGDLLRIRRDIARIRATIRPQRDVVDRLARGDTDMIRPKLLPYFRDLRDHLVRLDDAAAGCHDQLLTAFDLYLNKAAFEANEGIKFLTALTAVTLPAVVIGGWYGMNFAHMPELKTAHGYLIASAVTLVVTVLMIVYLRKKRWF